MKIGGYQVPLVEPRWAGLHRPGRARRGWARLGWIRPRIQAGFASLGLRLGNPSQREGMPPSEWAPSG